MVTDALLHTNVHIDGMKGGGYCLAKDKDTEYFTQSFRLFVFIQFFDMRMILSLILLFFSRCSFG